MIVTAFNPLQPLIDVAHEILIFFHDSVGLSWGVSIIFLTFTVRLAILPLTYKGVKGMQDLQRLQPEIKKLQERYKDDRQRLQQETMKFYQEHKVNPLSSCMPLLLQIPFFISLFYLLKGDEFREDIRGEEMFLFITDLAQKESGGALVALIVLYVVTQLGASLVTAISADKMQRYLMLGLPFLFVFFIFSFPAGLLVYWITTNFWTVGQQLAVKKFLPKPEPLSLPDSGGNGDGKPARGKPSGGGGGAKKADPEADAPRQSAFGRLMGGAASTGNGAKAEGGNGARSAKANGSGSAPAKAPPSSPRKKKKRSGRRRWVAGPR